MRFRLEPDDALILFTDGVLEARSDDGVFGEPRLRRLLSDVAGMTAGDVADRVASDAIDFQAGSPRDDLAVLVARRHGEPAPESEPEEPPASLAVETDA